MITMGRLLYIDGIDVYTLACSRIYSGFHDNLDIKPGFPRKLVDHCNLAICCTHLIVDPCPLKPWVYQGYHGNHCNNPGNKQDQGVVTPISAVLRAVTGDCDPIYGGCRCGLPYYSVYYQKITQSRWIFTTVTGSPAV